MEITCEIATLISWCNLKKKNVRFLIKQFGDSSAKFQFSRETKCPYIVHSYNTLSCQTIQEHADEVSTKLVTWCKSMELNTMNDVLAEQAHVLSIYVPMTMFSELVGNTPPPPQF